MKSEIISTNLIDDPDPEGTDKYGMLPLVSTREGDPAASEEDDEEAWDELVSDPSDSLTPGEAKAMVAAMAPLSNEEIDDLSDPLLEGLEYIDDTTHTDDILKIAQSTKGIDNQLDDAIYGEHHMRSPEERCERFDTDRSVSRTRGWKQIGNSVPITNFELPRDVAKYRLMNRFGNQVVREHTDWLIDQDRKAGVALRPRSYYENISNLWAKSKFQQNKLPTDTAMDGWHQSMGTFVGNVMKVYEKTASERIITPAKPDILGWGFRSLTRSVGRGVKRGASYAKKGIFMPLTLAQKVALMPIKKVVRRFTNKIVSRRANFLAKQRGGTVPTVEEKKQAKIWAKQFVRDNHAKYGGAIASLMGSSEHGSYNVDISMGSDVMGGMAKTVMLIALGPITLVAILMSLLAKAAMGGGAPAPSQGTPEAESEEAKADQADQANPDEASPDAAVNPEETSPSAAPDEGAGEITIEQLNAMNPQLRNRVKKMIVAGEIHLD